MYQDSVDDQALPLLGDLESPIAQDLQGEMGQKSFINHCCTSDPEGDNGLQGHLFHLCISNEL